MKCAKMIVIFLFFSQFQTAFFKQKYDQISKYTAETFNKVNNQVYEKYISYKSDLKNAFSTVKSLSDEAYQEYEK